MLVAGMDLRDLTLSELARQAGMAKSNVYRYFETREALLLDLLWDEWAGWYGALAADPPRRGHGAKALARLTARIARSLAERPLLCKLTAALPSVVEQNLSEERIVAFKLQSLLFFEELARFLHGRVPDLSEARYVRLVHDTVTLLVGLHAFASPPPVVARVLERPDLAFFRRDFEADLARMILALALATSDPS